MRAVTDCKHRKLKRGFTSQVCASVHMWWLACPAQKAVHHELNQQSPFVVWRLDAATCVTTCIYTSIPEVDCSHLYTTQQAPFGLSVRVKDLITPAQKPAHAMFATIKVYASHSHTQARALLASTQQSIRYVMLMRSPQSWFHNKGGECSNLNEVAAAHSLN